MGRLSNIQVLRGLAALAVVLFHAREEVDAVGRATHLPSFTVGAFGVDLFFTISGFVMVYASVPMFGDRHQALPFLAKRLVRIVPLYWTITLLFAPYVAHDSAEPMSRGAFVLFLVLSLAFVPYVSPANEDSFPLYPLGWTLDYEMAFYLCFAGALALPRRGAVALLSAAFIGLVALNMAFTLPGPLEYLFASQLLEFVGGMVVAELALSGFRLNAATAAVMILAGLIAVPASMPTFDLWWGSWRGVVWGAPAVAILAGAALVQRESGDGWLRRALESLGDASYTLYLVHYGLFIAVAALLARAVPLDRIPATAFIALLVALALAAALLIYRIAEAPMTRTLQRWLLRRPLVRPLASLGP